MGTVFACVWGVFALALGALFAFLPEIPAKKYISWTSSLGLGKVQERFAPRSFILVFYRLGGCLFMLLGILIPILAITGVLSSNS